MAEESWDTIKWSGYFFGKPVGTSGGVDKFPLRYIDEKSWSSQPKFREEIKAYRDDNTRDLTRITAKGTKSSFSFETRDGLHLADIMWIQHYFTSGESVPLERKITLKYWNDELYDYETKTFYRANMEFKIKYVTATDIIYDKLKLEFVEY